MRLKKNLCIILLAISLNLSACKLGGQASTTGTPLSPEAVFTAAAMTAQARMTELAASTPPPRSLTATPTTAAATPGVTRTAPAIAGSPTNTAPPVVSGTDKVEFVADLTVPDGTIFQPGEKFTKTWRLMNAGTGTWTTSYSLVYFSGEQMGGAASTPLPLEVPAGQTVDLSIQLTAPSKAGKYTGYWMLRNAFGTNFGLGPKSDGAFYVQINVSEPAETATGSPSGTGTPGVTASPTTSPEVVTDASLSVDAATVEEACPYVFTFTAQFTLSTATTVTYKLDVESGIPITLPEPSTSSLSAGAHEVTYTLEFTDSVSGTARLHVTSPEDVQSDPVSFSLTCK